MAGPRVLLIEDDDPLREGVAASLRSRGYDVLALRNGVTIDRDLDQFDPEVAVLDIGLVDGPDGFALATLLAGRASGPPFVFMTAAGGIDDRLRGFDLGAEDYIVKPFSTRELDSRLRVILRRREQLATDVEPSDLTLDMTARTALRDGSDLGLTPTEFELLVTLRSVQGRVWSKRELLRRVWGTDHHSTHIVEVYISNLRRKLEEHGPRIIVTHRGGGYSLRP